MLDLLRHALRRLRLASRPPERSGSTRRAQHPPSAGDRLFVDAMSGLGHPLNAG